MNENAKIIWVLFGDITDEYDVPITKYAQRIRNLYQQHKTALEKKGYTLGFGSEAGTTKHALLYHLGDDSTYGVVWHSHATQYGQLLGVRKGVISPSHISRVGKNLSFTALWGCSIKNAYEWRKHLRLNDKFPSDAVKRLATVATDIVSEDLGDLKPPSVVFIETYNKTFAYYTFRQWIDRLP